MKKISTYFRSDKYRDKVKPEITRLIAVIGFTLVYGIGVKWFLEQSYMPLYTSGIPGIAQLVRDFLLYRMKVHLTDTQAGTMIAVMIIVLNIPVLLIGWFGVSKKFTLYSMVSVVLQATVIGFLPKIDLGLTTPEHQLTVAVLGGLIIGFGVGGALKYGTSTGGLDIVAQFFSFKRGKTVGALSLTMNVGIALLGGLIMSGQEVNGETVLSWAITAYTILRIVVTTMVTDRIHTSYQHLSVEIITDYPEEISAAILEKVYRGTTMIKSIGAYSKKEKTLLIVVISSYELEAVTKIIQNVDSGAFVVIKPVRQVVGNFARKTIA